MIFSKHKPTLNLITLLFFLFTKNYKLLLNILKYLLIFLKLFLQNKNAVIQYKFIILLKK
jgi:hypothetical protein